jgi:hypothetical protein
MKLTLIEKLLVLVIPIVLFVLVYSMGFRPVKFSNGKVHDHQRLEGGIVELQPNKELLQNKEKTKQQLYDTDPFKKKSRYKRKGFVNHIEWSEKKIVANGLNKLLQFKMCI